MHVADSSGDVDQTTELSLMAAAAIPASLKAQGWSNARAFSATQFRQNPNTFFYRNVAPDQEQVHVYRATVSVTLITSSPPRSCVKVRRWHTTHQDTATMVSAGCCMLLLHVLVANGSVIHMHSR